MLSAEIAASRQRWDELMANLASLIPAGPASVLVDGESEQHAIVAGRLAATLNASGRQCFRLSATGHRIVLAAAPLERVTRATGWRLTTYDDAAERFLAIATRRSG